MHKTMKFCFTGRFALSEKLALKTPNVLIKNDVFRCFCAIFQNDRRSVAVRYGALKNSDKFALPTVFDVEKFFLALYLKEFFRFTKRILSLYFFKN
jgi:hypothetical protein